MRNKKAVGPNCHIMKYAVEMDSLSSFFKSYVLYNHDEKWEIEDN